MPRVITRTAHGPTEVKTPKDDSVWICRCGLSKDEQGKCDGSHKKTSDEDENKMYVYDENLNREEVASGCCGRCQHTDQAPLGNPPLAGIAQ